MAVRVRRGLTPNVVVSVTERCRRIRRRLARFDRPVFHGLSLAGALILAWLVVGGPGTDAHSYWSFPASGPYGGAVGNLDAFDAFRYSPPVGLAFLPFHGLPFTVFRIGWLAVEVACLWYVAGRRTLALVALYPVAIELAMGNVYIPLAAAVVAGFRHPAAWSFLVLTKVTPGVALLWFVVRREWRSLAIVLGVSASLAVVSFALAPEWWPAWTRMLVADASVPVDGPWPNLGFPLWLRLPVATALVIWGARTDRPWTVAVAACLAMPSIFVATFSSLVALLPIAARRRDLAQRPDERGRAPRRGVSPVID